MQFTDLDLLQSREMNYLPPHFSRITLSGIDVYLNKDSILNWIRSKLTGRFALIKYPVIDQNDKFKSSELVLGFEDDKEMTYFVLACPFFRR